MISQIPTAAIGTETCVGTPASPRAAPIPTKSEMQMPRLAITTADVASTDQRMPYSSRISSARPLPVTTPMRAASICTRPSEIVIRTIVHSSSYPYLAPTDEYVAIPPASFPAFAAISPGPSSPRKAKIRARRGLSRAGRRGRPRGAERIRRMTGGTRAAIELSAGGLHWRGVYLVLPPEAKAPAPASGKHRLEHVVNRDHADHLSPIVDHGDRGEVVIGHQSGDLLEGGIRGQAGDLVLDNARQAASRVRAHQGGDRHAAIQGALLGADEHRGEQLRSDPAAPHAVQRPPGRGGAVQQDEVGAHQAARLGGVVAEQRSHLHAMADRQQREHLLAPVLVQLAHDVRRVVGSHPGEDRPDLGVGAILEELALVLVVELLEHIRLELAVVIADGLDDLLALASRRRLHQIA